MLSSNVSALRTHLLPANGIFSLHPVLSSSDRSVLLGVVECVNKRDGVYDEDDKYVIRCVHVRATAAVLWQLQHRSASPPLPGDKGYSEMLRFKDHDDSMT